MIEENFGHKIKVQYLGESGLTKTCVLAITAILNSGILPERATIVTHVYNRTATPVQEEHLFIFWNWQYLPVVIIPSGFSSGYTGEGPKGFQIAFCLIKEREIPIDEIFVNEAVFNAIDKGKITYTDAQILKDIRADSEPFTGLIDDIYLRALERGHLWRLTYLNGYQFENSINIAISNMDLFSAEVGKKLRLANIEVKKKTDTESWQNAGLLIRDAWIELSRCLCEKENIDISDIEKDKVVDKLKKLKLDEHILNLCKASFNLSNKVQHDRQIKQEIAIACVNSAFFAMQSITYKHIKGKGFK